MRWNKITLFIFMLFLVLPFVYATQESATQNQDVKISHPVRFNEGINSGVQCNITVRDPDNFAIVSYAPFVYNSTTEENEYTVDKNSTDKLGDYCYTITCNLNGVNETEGDCVLVTPTGRDSLVGFYFLAISIIYGLLIFGFYREDVTITVLATFGLYFLGIYILFFGFDIHKNYLTDGFAWVTLGIAFYISTRVSYDYITS